MAGAAVKRNAAVFGGLLFVLVIAVLSISVVTLVKVFSDPATLGSNPQNDNGDGGGPSVSSTSRKPDDGRNGPGTNKDPVNVPLPRTIDQQSNPIKFDGFSSFAKQLGKTVNITADPCNNFYEYACGSYKEPIGFDVLEKKNHKLIANQFNKATYIRDYSTPIPVKQAFYFYKSCVSAFRQVINVDFPALTSPSTSTNSPAPYDTFPDPKTFARAIGHLKYVGFLQTLVAIDVDTNWRNPQDYLPYALFVDQPQLVYANTYYIKYWDHLRDNYFNDTYTLLANYARISNVQVDESQLKRDVQGILDLEFRIATRVNTPVTERRKFDRQYNPMTTKVASQKYSWLDWDVLINESYRGPELQYYQFVVQEPGVFATIWDKVKSMKTFRNRDIYNYLYFRLILENKNYLPNPNPTAFKYQYSPDAPNENGFIGHRLPKPLFPFPPPTKETGERSDDEISDLCITQNIWGLQYANARVMIDAMFSSKAERDALRDRVGKIIASIIDAFHAMVTQLDWMTDNTKRGAYNKLAHLVKNIAYPDFVVVDSPTDSDGKPQKSLPGHYDWLDIDEDDDYATILNKINVFKHKMTFARLTQYDGNDRQDFDNPPAIVNAWYQDTLNSITFPLGILQKPFYDAEYPMSVNFGGLGVVAGHELTHGFDDKGVQWDGTGVLRSWMDTTSQTSFNTMAQCVVKQYNGIQPISDLNIDGTQTQGENIADNGGIRAAYRAYQAYVSLYGPDPQLPDETFEAFTQDQLFFLSFAQAWCRKDPAEDDLARQLLVDAHSPAKYRVMGTIQNFPAFRTAFNCPAGITGIPPTTTTLPPHNIPTVPQAKYPDWNKSWQDDYEGLRIDYFTDTSQDPCTDFYTYSCGAYEMFYTPPIQRNEFVNAETDVMDALATGLKKEIDEFSDPIPVQQVKKFFGKCQEANSNWTNYLKSYNKTKNAIELLEIWTGVTFPTFYVAPVLGTDTDENDTGGNSDGDNNDTNDDQEYDDGTPGPVKGWLEPYTLTMVLAGLSGFLDTDTIITPFVDTNWGDPQGVEPYLLHIDQAQLSLPKNYYKGKAWELVKNNHKLDVLTMFLQFQKVRNDTLPAADVLKSDIEDILRFEWTLANKLMINESLRTVNRSRSYNPMWLDDADDTIENIWIWYYAAWLSLGGPEGLLMEVIYDNLKVNLAEPGYLRSLSASLSDANAFGFTPRQFINYLFYRVVRTNREYLPPLPMDETNKAQQLYVQIWPNDALQIGDMGVDLVDRPLLIRPIVGPPRFVRSLNRNLGIWKSRGGSDGDFRCVLDTVQRMGTAAARIYLNEVWPDVRQFQTARSLVGEMVENIGIAFRSMVDQLTWMSADAKVRASNKISQLVKNVGVPDFVLDDSQLSGYYAEMTIDENDSYLDIMNKLTRLNLLKKWGHLGRTGRGTRRDEYTHAAVVADAWYQAHLNSLTIGAPLLTFPYFSAQWPTAVNYGTLGTMIGNRIAQALSQEGMQWTGDGTLYTWIDGRSVQSLNRMNRCNANKYSGYCPLQGSSLDTQCVDGQAAVGQAFADNGGRLFILNII
ncbi:peptidase family m13 domain-containing protein [Ditylenchus destructor]|nr:peptidase family m13 domain-containing protein [Ditylenchus destructor]